MNKKAAMEMSVGTIVTIVLLMSVLVLGLVLISNIFKSSNKAVGQIDSQIQNQINKLFSEEEKEVVVYPDSQTIVVKKGDIDENARGFAFSIQNRDVESHSYFYNTYASPDYDFQGKCGSKMTIEKADSYILLASGSTSLEPGRAMINAKSIRFSIPESAIPCTIPYIFEVLRDDEAFADFTIYVTIK